MPELPEVEFATRHLRRWISGGLVVAASSTRTRVVHGSLAVLVGRRVRAVERRGKWMRVTFDDGRRLFSHLGMTGKWVLREKDADPERFERARIDVRKAGRVRSVRYLDPRLLGRLQPSREDLATWKALGPDALDDGVDVRRLAERLRKRKKTIKEALLDQTLLAGVGNIQATEALWFAGVDPRARTDRLDDAQVRAIAAGIRRSIARTLRVERAPEITYVEERGAENPFLVYGRGGEPCPRCTSTLKRIELGGRGTVFCPRCQRR